MEEVERIQTEVEPSQFEQVSTRLAARSVHVSGLRLGWRQAHGGRHSG
jgi:hypothetical protein